MRAGRQASPKTLPDFEILKVIEPKKCHPVRDRLLASGKVSSAKARGVFWKTPGYTKAKQRTAAITRLAASIRKGNPPAEKKGRQRQALSGRPGLAQMTHADRQTHRQQRQTDTDTARERQQNHTQTDRERPHGDRQTHRQTGTQKQTKTNRDRQTEIHRDTETQPERQRQTQTGRQKQTRTETDRDRQRCCDKTTYAYACSHKPGCKQVTSRHALVCQRQAAGVADGKQRCEFDSEKQHSSRRLSELPGERNLDKTTRIKLNSAEFTTYTCTAQSHGNRLAFGRLGLVLFERGCTEHRAAWQQARAHGLATRLLRQATLAGTACREARASTGFVLPLSASADHPLECTRSLPDLHLA